MGFSVLGLLAGAAGFGAVTTMASALGKDVGGMKAQAPGSMMIENQDQARQAAERSRKRSQGASGRADTIKTGPQGLGEIGDENVESKSLLGY